MDTGRVVRAVGAAAVAFAVAGPCAAQVCETGVVSAGTQYGTANGSSYGPAMTPDGRYVAFVSAADNFGVPDEHAGFDVYVLDRMTGGYDLVSVTESGGAPNADCLGASISDDGRYVAFISYATNIVDDDTNGTTDVYLFDRQLRTVSRVNVSATGEQANSYTVTARISGNGRYVVFDSYATNLVLGDSNSRADIFVRDLVAGTIERANLGPGGVEASGGDSNLPSASADGRYVVFASSATNLMGTTITTSQVYVRDRAAAITLIASTPGNSIPGNGYSDSPGISANGRYVVYSSSSTNIAPPLTSHVHAYIFDLQTETPSRVSLDSSGFLANRDALAGSATSDGRYVTFVSAATNLAPQATGWYYQVYVRDTLVGTTSIASVSETGEAGNDYTSPTVQPAPITGDGRLVVFSTYASNLVSDDVNQTRDVLARDLEAQTNAAVSAGVYGSTGNSASSAPSASGDGRLVAFQSLSWNLLPGNIDSSPTRLSEIFVRDRSVPMTTRVTLSAQTGYPWYGDPNGESYHPTISRDGTTVAFESLATNLMPGNTPAATDTNQAYDIYVRDLAAARTSRVSLSSFGLQGDGPSRYASVSGDGRYVAFESGARNLVANDTNARWDVFLRDRATGLTARISRSSGGAQGNNDSAYGRVSADGRFVAFMSYASNLVPGDTNFSADIFVHDRQGGQTRRVSVGAGGGGANGSSYAPSISDNGRFIAFDSDATNLVADDSNSAPDVFVHDTQTGETSRASLADDGSQGNGGSYAPSISMSGRYVAFESDASNLVADDANGRRDTFVRDLFTGRTTRASLAPGSGELSGDSGEASIAGDGLSVAFSTGAPIAEDLNGTLDVLVRDRPCEVCPADFNGDGFVDGIDYDSFVAAFETGDPAADVNGDGFVDGIDYDQFVEAFEIGC